MCIIKKFITALFLLVLSGIAIIVLFGLTSHTAHPDNVWQTGTTTGNAITTSAVFTALLSAFWAYEGWNSAGFLGGEIKNPNRNLPLGMTIGLFIVISVYLLANITYLSVLPIQVLEQIHASHNKISALEAVKTFCGKTGRVFILFFSLITPGGRT